MRFYVCTLLALSCLVAFSTSSPAPLVSIQSLASNGTEAPPSDVELLNYTQFKVFIGSVKSLLASSRGEGDIDSELLSKLLNLSQHLDEVVKSPQVLQVAVDLQQLGVDVNYGIELFSWIISLVETIFS